MPYLHVAITLALLLMYGAYMFLAPRKLAWRAHADLRLAWFDALSEQVGSEILAVQTLRNSLMTATMTASTAALGLMGALGLAAPALADMHGEFRVESFSPRLAYELTLLMLLTLALVSTTLAIRYYHHAGFVGAMPQASAARQTWGPTGRAHLKTAGVLYSLGLRSLIWVTPFVAGLVLAPAGPVLGLALLIGLLAMEG